MVCRPASRAAWCAIESMPIASPDTIDIGYPASPDINRWQTSWPYELYAREPITHRNLCVLWSGSFPRMKRNFGGLWMFSKVGGYWWGNNFSIISFWQEWWCAAYSSTSPSNHASLRKIAYPSRLTLHNIHLLSIDFSSIRMIAGLVHRIVQLRGKSTERRRKSNEE